MNNKYDLTLSTFQLNVVGVQMHFILFKQTLKMRFSDK